MTGRSGSALERHLAERLQRLVPAGEVLLLAVSGGADSMALLRLAWRTAAQHGHPLIVGHVDHGIDPASAEVAESVARHARLLGLPFHVRSLALGADTSETAARTARRAALREMAEEGGASRIVLAHHADDQAETVLMRLVRGSGPAGLAGMAARRGRWVRPLLDVSRAELAAYLAATGVSAWRDPANRDPRHLRSWLRERVLPLLAERFPDIQRTLRRSADLAAMARQGWNEVPAEIPALDFRVESAGISVAALPLRGYRSPLRHAILAALGRRAGVRLGRRRLTAIDALIDAGRGSRRIALSASHEAELAFGRLALLRTAGVEAGVALPLGVDQPVTIGVRRLSVASGPARSTSRSGEQTAIVPGPDYQVRAWRAGDRIRPLGGSGSRAVAVLFREAGVPPSERSEWPVVVAGSEATIVWVPGICRSDARLPEEGTEAWNVDCAIA